MTSRSLRALFVVNNPEFFVTHRLPLGEALRAVADVEVAGPPGPAAEAVERLGFRYHPVPMARTGLNPFQDLRTLFALAALFRARHPHLVHLISIKPILYGGIAARLCSVPATVAAFTGLGYAFVSSERPARAIRLLIRPLLAAAVTNPKARIILQNGDDARLLGDVVHSSRALVRIVRGSGVDPRAFDVRPEAEGDPVVLFAGRLLRDKGVHEFASAARRLRAAGARARFVVVGRPDPQNPTSVTADVIRGYAADDAIEWWGHRDDMPEVFARSHIVCLPTTYGEGVPKVLIEAAASGRPIVATDWPGCREIVRHGVNGLLVAPRDAAALEGALDRLLSSPIERRRMGNAGRAIAVGEFSSAHVIRGTFAVYRELLASVAWEPAAIGA